MRVGLQSSPSGVEAQPSAGLRRRAPGPGGRKDLVWERGKAARESGLVTSLSEQAQKQRRTRGGARGSDPGESHPDRSGCPGSSRGAWSSWGSFRRCPGGLSRTPATASVPGESLGAQGCSWPESGTRDGLPTGQPGPRVQVRGPESASWRSSSGTWTFLQLHIWMMRPD